MAQHQDRDRASIVKRKRKVESEIDLTETSTNLSTPIIKWHDSDSTRFGIYKEKCDKIIWILPKIQKEG